MTVQKWSDDAPNDLNWETAYKQLAWLFSGYPQTTFMTILTQWAAALASHLCAPRIYRRFPNKKTWFDQDNPSQDQGTEHGFSVWKWTTTGWPDMPCLTHSELQKKSHTEKLDNCYTGNDSRRMWQGIVTNYKGNKHTASTSEPTLPD